MLRACNAPQIALINRPPASGSTTIVARTLGTFSTAQPGQGAVQALSRNGLGIRQIRQMARPHVPVIFRPAVRAPL